MVFFRFSILQRFYLLNYVSDFISFSDFVAPDASPSNIRPQTLASISTLNLQWNRIPEEKANGIIRGYYIEYNATNLNGQYVQPEKRVTKTFHVRGNRYATVLTGLVPGSTYEIRMFGYTIKNGTKSSTFIAGKRDYKVSFEKIQKAF